MGSQRPEHIHLRQLGEAEYVADTRQDSAGGITRISFQAVSSGDTILYLEYQKTSKDTLETISSDAFGMVVVVN